MEASFEGTHRAWSWYLSYALVNATFDTALTIQAPDNPAADDNGEIAVRPGDRIPIIPRHALKAGAEYQGLRDRQCHGALWSGTVELYGRIENAIGASYDSFGLFGDADELGFDSPRFLSPAAPRALLIGLRATF